jgi:hypothetical protein
MRVPSTGSGGWPDRAAIEQVFGGHGPREELCRWPVVRVVVRCAERHIQQVTEAPGRFEWQDEGPAGGRPPRPILPPVQAEGGHPNVLRTVLRHAADQKARLGGQLDLTDGIIVVPERGRG